MKIKQYVNKGLHRENDPILTPRDTVWDLKNMRITGNSAGGTYAVESIRGNTVYFTLKPFYVPILFESIEDKIIVLSKRTDGVDNNGEVGVVNTLADPVTYTPLYNHIDFNFVFDQKTEGEAYRIDAQHETLYWWDNTNNPRHFNIATAIYSTYIASGDIAIDAQYMVVNGEVTYDGLTYGPNITNGTVFMGTVGGGTTYVATPGSLLIAYRSIELLNVNPKVNFNIPRFNKFIGGSVTTGSYFYLYQMGDDAGNWGPTSMNSAPVQLTSFDPSTTGGTWYNDVQINNDDLGDDNETVTARGIQIIIDNIDTRYNRVRIFMVKAIDDITFEAPKIILDLPITGASMTFNHVDDTGLETVLIDDLILNFVAILRNKTGAIHKNFLFYGNFEVQEDVKADLSGCVQTAVPLMMPADGTYAYLGHNPGDPIGANNGFNLYGTLPIKESIGAQPNGVPAPQTLPYPDMWYKVEGTGNITLEPGGPTYNAGDFFQVTVADAYTYYNVGAGFPTVIPQIRIQKYDGEFFSHPIQEDFQDNQGTTVPHYVRSLWRNETYRSALVLVTTKGSILFGHWLGDLKMPDLSTSPLLTFSNSDNLVSTVNLGIQFDEIDFNAIVAGVRELYNDNTITLADLPNYFDGFAIVRAKRDATILGQGLLYPASFDNQHVPAAYCIFGAGGNKQNDYFIQHSSQLAQDLYHFYSPEFRFGLNDDKGFQDTDQLEIGYFTQQFHPVSASGANGDWGMSLTPFTVAGNPFASYYAKRYKKAGFPGSTTANAVNRIDKEFSRNWRRSDGAFTCDGSGTMMQLFSLVDAYASGVVASPGKPEILYGVAMDATFLLTQDGGNFTGGYLDHRGGGHFFNNVPIVNYVRPKTVLYGGQDESALAQTNYYFTGHYQRFDAGFIAHLLSTAGGKRVGDASGIQVFGGDCYVNLVDFVRVFADPLNTYITSYLPGEDASWFHTSDVFPCETSINTWRRQGRTVGRNNQRYTPGHNNDGLSASDYGGPEQQEQFVYNKAYSSFLFWDFPIPAQPSGFIPRRIYEKTTINSDRKVDTARDDSFLRMREETMVHFEGQFGAITNLKVKNENLFVFQKRGVNYLPVDEKTAIANVLAKPVTLSSEGGVGSPNNVSDYFGNQHQAGLVVYPEGFVWIDVAKRSICHLDASVQQINAKDLLAFFNESQFDYLKLNDTPLLGRGVVGGYDPRFKEVLLAFTNYDIDDGVPTFFDFVIAYDILHKQFAGKYDHAAGLYHTHDNMLISYPAARFDAELKGIEADVAYLAGTILSNNLYPDFSDSDEIYILKNDLLADGAPVVPSDDLTNWALVRKLSDVFLENSGDIGKIYGIVRSSNMVVIVTDGSSDAKFFQYFTADPSGQEAFFDTILFSNSYQQATDSDVENNDEYSFNNRTWNGSVPFDQDSGERMVDRYLKIDFTRSHRVNNSPVTSDDTMVKVVTIDSEVQKAD